MKVLVTGSSGYIGYNFIQSYQQRYQFETFSLLNNKLKEINFSSVDTVLHAAALVHQKGSPPYGRYYKINVDYPVNLAKLAKKNGVKQFVFLSTVAVYGEEHEFITETTQCNPVTPYGKSKLMAEKQLLSLADDDFMVSIVRLPMVYGKRAPGNIGTLVNLVKILPVLPFARVHNKRSFIFIGNLCNILNNIIQKKVSGLFLVSDDRAVTTTELISLIANALDKKIFLIQVPFFKSLLKLLKPSIYKKLYGNLEIDNCLTRETLKFINPYNVEEGIALMIKDRR